ncbi:BTB/POZ domain-containing protein At3g05675 [Mercurialis annua]|uniref:BTB/POZ domain-containing protein At3g05675 n=1 Tax=Mercurialis annua TaxID=3986 RepID=UPI002160161B|nr:BTB/POZ domain-containing protein At3g05675 [Mercurialis annua]
MEKTGVAGSCRLGDESTSDFTVCLRNREGRPEIFYCHSSILVNKCNFFADWVSNPDSGTSFQIQCSEVNYDYHVFFLKLLYMPVHMLLNCLDSVKSAVGVLEVSVAFGCEDITKSCNQYLEAVPWEDKEEEEILKVVSKLGSVAMPIISRIQPVDLSATKNVFVSAVRFATSTGGSCPPFGDELRISAQEQVEYMLGEDEDTPLITADDEVKSVVKMGLSEIFSSFEKQLSSLLLCSDLVYETAEAKALQSVSDLQWLCNILPKMELMKDFVANWADISCNILRIIEDTRLDYVMWGLKIKLIEVTSKVLEAVGYGNVILPAPCRVRILNAWLPYIRKLKPLVDSKSSDDSTFPHKMDEDLCQSIEGAIVSMILALPSNDQAEILTDWMKAEQVRYPDLTEAFEVWCYRTKSAKRRLVEGLDKVENTSAFDLSI